MNLLVNDRIDLDTLDPELRRLTNNLGDLLVAAMDSSSPRVESTHVLMALGGIANGVTQRGFGRRGISAAEWRSGLASFAANVAAPPPLAQLSVSSLDDTGAGTFRRAGELCDAARQSRVTEAMLLLAALENLTKKADEGLKSVDVDVIPWMAELRREIAPPTVPRLFKEGGSLELGLFSATGRKVLRLMKTEGEALGFQTLDLRHLLLAFLASESSALNAGLHSQGLSPRNLHAALMLRLRARGKRTRASSGLDRAHLDGLLGRVLEEALVLAAKEGHDRVAERHLARAFLGTSSAIQSFLSDEGANVERLRASVEAPWEPGEEETADDPEAADVETVRRRLLERLVGQDEAIERILPYIQRMRFGFSVPDRPVGVFLFCGPSGTGKTEMAKELARAVYGGDDNFVFLEMGLFARPESMNIFVGAPPGYIGFGEGKLTNGLRDKPRAVILFDEIEKADPKVLDALLRFLDEGKIDDPAGPVRDGSQCIAILTSNVGGQLPAAVARGAAGGPGSDSLRKAFLDAKVRPEFLNRVDELILFNDFSPAAFREIASRVQRRLCERLERERGIVITVAPELMAAIGAECTRLAQGARPALRLVMTHVVTPVIDFIVRHAPPEPVRLSVTLASSGGEQLRAAVAQTEKGGRGS
jgi:ATP-dependent Clp protease ATP-binding subunit ClpC